ncbi:hypothetical protein [Streptomyces sp. NPDC017941]|uniref:hypothetical protein n=1 Tax=unclassified Streptomyces TaxID=2593676 RepID=UPI0037ADFC89
MTTSPPPASEPDASTFHCPSDQVGLCAACHRKTHRYGRGGAPLCQWCAAPVMAKWGPNVRYTSTRGQQ